MQVETPGCRQAVTSSALNSAVCRRRRRPEICSIVSTCPPTQKRSSSHYALSPTTPPEGEIPGRLPQSLISHFPDEKLTISTSDASFGLQLADVYLWLVNRAMSKNTLPNALRHFAASLVDPRTIDVISISGMVAQFQAFEKQLPKVQGIPDDLKAKIEPLSPGTARKSKISAWSSRPPVRQHPSRARFLGHLGCEAYYCATAASCQRPTTNFLLHSFLRISFGVG